MSRIMLGKFSASLGVVPDGTKFSKEIEQFLGGYVVAISRRVSTVSKSRLSMMKIPQVLDEQSSEENVSVILILLR